MYARLLITTFIGLYASRVVLLQLGIDDFGLFSVVGGLVTMLNVLSTTMISTSTRFLATEIGKKENGQIDSIFNALRVIHVLFSLVLIGFVEIVGVWYVKNHLNVRPDQINNALFVLQTTTLSAVFATLSIPAQGLITSFEKFTVRAVLEVTQSVLNLLAVLLLVVVKADKLIMYALFLLSIQFLISSFYSLYARIKYPECVKWKLNKDKKTYREISSFFTWQLVYVGGSVGSNQGGVLLMNLFFGTAINAAYGVAQRVNQFVFSFVKNMNQAALPQIMKSYSYGNQERSVFLINKLSRITFFIMLIPSVPIVMSLDFVLKVWLKTVPLYTDVFIILILLRNLISSMESGFDSMIEATGKIKKTKITYAVLFLLALPFSYFMYTLKAPPYVVVAFFILSEFVFFISQLRILNTLTDFSTKNYFFQTVMPIGFVLASLIPLLIIKLSYHPTTALHNIVLLVFSTMFTLASIYFIGLQSGERIQVRSLIKNAAIKFHFK